MKTRKYGINPLFDCFHASYLPILMEIGTEVLIPKIAKPSRDVGSKFHDTYFSMNPRKCFSPIQHVHGLKTQSFRFGMKNRPLGNDQTSKRELTKTSKMLELLNHVGRHSQRHRLVACLPTHCEGVNCVIRENPCEPTKKNFRTISATVICSRIRVSSVACIITSWN